MRALLQRVTGASVEADRQVIASIDRGLVTLLGVAAGDGPDDVRYLAEKILHLRIFDDERGRFQHSLLDTGGSCLLVSQFTLLANTPPGSTPGLPRRRSARGGRAAGRGRRTAAALGRGRGGGGTVRRADGRPSGQRRTGDDPPRFPRAGMKAAAAVAFTGSLVDEFLERLRVEDGSSALTIQAYRRDLARLAAFLRTRRRTIETARPDDLVDHLEALRRAGLSPRTLARGLAAIRGVYRFGRAAGLVRDRPGDPPRHTAPSSPASPRAVEVGRHPAGGIVRARPARATGGIARSSSSSTAPGSARPSSSGSARRT